jgi:hypothetical protein
MDLFGQTFFFSYMCLVCSCALDKDDVRIPSHGGLGVVLQWLLL